jgi:hypothetical protein
MDLRNPLVILWILWGLLLGLGAIFGARRLARSQTTTDNAPSMYIVTGLLMVGLVSYVIWSLGFRDK